MTVLGKRTATEPMENGRTFRLRRFRCQRQNGIIEQTLRLMSEHSDERWEDLFEDIDSYLYMIRSARDRTPCPLSCELHNKILRSFNRLRDPAIVRGLAPQIAIRLAMYFTHVNNMFARLIREAQEAQESDQETEALTESESELEIETE